VEKTFRRVAIGSTLQQHKLQFGLVFWPVSTGRKPVAPSTLLTPLGGTLTLGYSLSPGIYLKLNPQKKDFIKNKIMKQSCNIQRLKALEKPSHS